MIFYSTHLLCFSRLSVSVLSTNPAGRLPFSEQTTWRTASFFFFGWINGFCNEYVIWLLSRPFLMSLRPHIFIFYFSSCCKTWTIGFLSIFCECSNIILTITDLTFIFIGLSLLRCNCFFNLLPLSCCVHFISVSFPLYN